jgi:two-component system, chemotaxis family, sensor kinase CheA
LARLGTETFAIPVTHVIETIELHPEDACTVDGQSATLVREQQFRLVHLRDTVGLPRRDVARVGGYPKAVTVNVRGRRAALVVDDFVGQQDIVVKRFDSPHGAPALFGGATILSDGAPALIVDVNNLVSHPSNPR